MNYYIKNGLDKDLVDPDRGVNLEKKRLNSGAADEVDAEIQTDLPSDGFECGISVLPRTSFSQIWKHLIEDVEIRKKQELMKGRSWPPKSRFQKDTTFINLATFDRCLQKRMKIIYSLKALFLRR